MSLKVNMSFVAIDVSIDLGVSPAQPHVLKYSSYKNVFEWFATIPKMPSSEKNPEGISDRGAVYRNRSSYEAHATHGASIPESSPSVVIPTLYEAFPPEA